MPLFNFLGLSAGDELFFKLKFLELEGFLCLNFGSTFKGTEKKLVSRLDWLVDSSLFQMNCFETFQFGNRGKKVHLEVNSLESFKSEDEKSFKILSFTFSKKIALATFHPFFDGLRPLSLFISRQWEGI